jgi:hypothetical protein
MTCKTESIAPFIWDKLKLTGTVNFYRLPTIPGSCRVSINGETATVVDIDWAQPTSKESDGYSEFAGYTVKVTPNIDNQSITVTVTFKSSTVTTREGEVTITF